MWRERTSHQLSSEKSRARGLDHRAGERGRRAAGIGSTPEGRHYSGVGGTGVAVIFGGGWAGSSSFNFSSNSLSSGSGSV